MKVYYNEIEKKKCAALKALMEDGHISMGDVDDRPIQEVQANDLVGYTRCHFFAGIGVWDYALKLAKWEPDRNVWTGSCPCQDFSSAGPKTAQLGKRHLWPHWFRLIKESKPSEIFGEQTAGAIAKGWLDDAFYDLEAEKNSCAAAVLPALCVGSPHDRPRIWFVAQSERTRSQEQGFGKVRQETAAHWKTNCFINASKTPVGWFTGSDGRKRAVEPGIRFLADGYPESMGLLHSAGDAINSYVAAEFIKAYRECVA